MPIASSDVVEAFDDLGYTMEDPKVIDRLCSLCDNYDIDQDQVSCQYLAFAKKHKLNAPTLTIIDQFENDVIKGLKAKSQENAKNHIYDSSTIHELNRDNDEDDIIDAYGTPKTVRTKRQMTPESGINKRRLGTTLNDTFSPESLSQTPHAQGKKYGSRDNAGKVLIRHGESVTQEVWTNMSDFYRPDIKPYDAKRNFPSEYRFMFERLREKAGLIDETICYLGDEMKEKHNLEEPVGFNPNMPMNEKFPTLGRIFCDSEGRLNANSVLLQGSQDLSRGRALPLDLSQVNDFTEILRKNGESKFQLHLVIFS